MTFPCKEEVIVLEKLAKKQYQIYPDAADYGIEMEKINVPHIRQIIQNIKDVFGNKEYKFKETKWTHGKEVIFNIPIEEDEGYFFGLKLKLTYNNDVIRKKKFMTIEINNTRLWAT